MASTVFPATLAQDKRDFVISFYAVSDDRSAVDSYVAFLTEDVQFVMGLKTVQGAQAVREIRKTMWNGIRSRHHVPQRVYVSDEAATELMIHGTVEYGLENGHAVECVGWAALMVFAPGPSLQLRHYQVWLDTAKLVEALKA